MLKYLILAVALVASTGAQAQSVRGRTLGGPVAKQMAYFTQDVTLSGGPGEIMQATVGPLTSSIDGFGVSKAVTKLPSSPVGSLPRVSVPNPVAQDAALRTAIQWAADEMPGFQSRVGTWLRSQGLSTAVMNFTQEIMVTTAEGPMRRSIAFNATIDSRGVPTYGNPKIVNPDPTLVEAVYTSRAPAEGLPSTWQFPDAGTIKWRLLNKRYEVISNWQTVNVGGAYDVAPGSSDPDTGLKCLVDARLGSCPAGSATIRSIIDSVGAAWGLVTYIRQIEPVYEVNPQTGETVAVAAITVDERKYDCDTYSNKGNFGFVLALQADQYFVEPQSTSTRYTMVGSLGGKGLSPTHPYSKSVPVSALGNRHPDTVIISPELNSNELWLRTDRDKMKSVIHIAPVVSEMAGKTIDFYGGPSIETEIIGQTRQYHIGQYGDNYWGYGQYDQIVYFDLPNPKALERLIFKHAHYDDLMLVSLNGVVLFVGPHGGNMLELSQGVPESDCSNMGSYWTCWDPYAQGAYAGMPTQVWDGNGQDGGFYSQCPAGTRLSYEDSRCYYKVPKANYANCQVYGWDDSASMYCGNSTCPMYTAQYVQGATTYGAGCSAVDLKQSWHHSPMADMTPYLRAGQNVIFIRTVVGGNGEGYIDIEGRMCGTEAGLPNSAPAGPGAPAVDSTLTPLAQ